MPKKHRKSTWLHQRLQNKAKLLIQRFQPRTLLEILTMNKKETKGRDKATKQKRIEQEKKRKAEHEQGKENARYFSITPPLPALVPPDRQSFTFHPPNSQYPRDLNLQDEHVHLPRRHDTIMLQFHQTGNVMRWQW